MSNRFRYDVGIKTILLPEGSGFNASLKSMFYGCSNIEVIIINPLYALPTNIIECFSGCKKLRRIQGIIGATYLASDIYAQRCFQECFDLEYVQITFNMSLSFADSPNLSLESLIYGVNQKNNSNAVTITVHPDVYAKLTEGDEEWQALNTLALSKQITFATA